MNKSLLITFEYDNFNFGYGYVYFFNEVNDKLEVTGYCDLTIDGDIIKESCEGSAEGLEFIDVNQYSEVEYQNIFDEVTYTKEQFNELLRGIKNA